MGQVAEPVVIMVSMVRKRYHVEFIGSPNRKSQHLDLLASGASLCHLQQRNTYYSVNNLCLYRALGR